MHSKTVLKDGIPRNAESRRLSSEAEFPDNMNIPKLGPEEKANEN